jgi:hypothetical protein
MIPGGRNLTGSDGKSIIGSDISVFNSMPSRGDGDNAGFSSVVVEEFDLPIFPAFQ